MGGLGQLKSTMTSLRPEPQNESFTAIQNTRQITVLHIVICFTNEMKTGILRALQADLLEMYYNYKKPVTAGLDVRAQDCCM
jgi:hypothetical protein